MKPTVCQFALFVCILVKKIECVPTVPGCGARRYYSEFVPGCVYCYGNCKDQDARDIDRCKEACETKTTGTSRLVIKTKAPKHGPVTTIPSLPKGQSTMGKFITPNKTTQPFKKTGHSTNSERSGKAGSSDNSVGLGVGIGIGALVVFLVFLAAYMWRRSRVPNVKSHEEEQVEICTEPSTSSQEPSPVTKRSQSEQASSIEEIDGIRLPLPETETAENLEKNTSVCEQTTENLILPLPEEHHMSSLHLEEIEH